MTARRGDVLVAWPAPPLALAISMTDPADIALLDLDGGVVNGKIMQEIFGGPVQEIIAPSIRHNQVGSEHVFGRARRPDMQIMDALHSRQLGQIIQYSCRIDLVRDTGHGEMQGIFQ